MAVVGAGTRRRLGDAALQLPLYRHVLPHHCGDGGLLLLEAPRAVFLLPGADSPHVRRGADHLRLVPAGASPAGRGLRLRRRHRSLWTGMVREPRDGPRTTTSTPRCRVCIFSWTFIFGFLFWNTGPKVLSSWGCSIPRWTFFAIIITGNHYIADAVVGIAMVAVVFVCSRDGGAGVDSGEDTAEPTGPADGGSGVWLRAEPARPFLKYTAVCGGGQSVTRSAPPRFR